MLGCGIFFGGNTYLARGSTSSALGSAVSRLGWRERLGLEAETSASRYVLLTYTLKAGFHDVYYAHVGHASVASVASLSRSIHPHQPVNSSNTHVKYLSLSFCEAK